MTTVIGDPIRSGRTALAVTLGLLALAAAPVSLGCTSRARVAGGQPIGRAAPPAEVSAAAPGETVSPEAQTSDAPLPPVLAEQPPRGDDGGSPAKQETAPSVATVPNRREATSPGVKAPKNPATPAPSEPPRAKKSPEPGPSVSPGEGWNQPRGAPPIVRPAHHEGPFTAAGQRCSTGSRHRDVARGDLESARRSRQVCDAFMN